jgi:hypothetical protein
MAGAGSALISEGVANWLGMVGWTESVRDRLTAASFSLHQRQLLSRSRIQKLASLTSLFSMQIFVNVPNRKPLTLNVDANDDIGHIKSKVCDVAQLPSTIKLGYQGKVLEPGKSLYDYGITDQANIVANGNFAAGV